MKDEVQQPEEGQTPAEQEGQSISTFVNQEYVNQLIEMGFPKNVAEKALFFTLA